jgi:hypothetical protein
MTARSPEHNGDEDHADNNSNNNNNNITTDNKNDNNNDDDGDDGDRSQREESAVSERETDVGGQRAAIGASRLHMSMTSHGAARGRLTLARGGSMESADTRNSNRGGWDPMLRQLESYQER